MSVNAPLWQPPPSGGSDEAMLDAATSNITDVGYN